MELVYGDALILGFDICFTNRENENMEQRKGFTLIELLLTIAIMMILSGIGLMSFMSALQRSRDSTRKNDIASITRALEAFASDFGDYPASSATGKITGCDNSSGSFTDCTWGNRFESYLNGQKMTYMAKLPNDPQSTSGHSYYYEKTVTGFNLYSILEDTKDPSYKNDAGSGIRCGDVLCNYVVSESGRR